MTPAELLRLTVRPALAEATTLLGLPLASPEACLQLLATAIHETGLRTRVQAGGGPGRSFWQVEAALDAIGRDGAGVMVPLAVHPVGQMLLDRLMQELGSGRERVSVPLPVLHAALGDPAMDRLACKVVRLILWLDPHPLPGVGDEEGAWQAYRRAWRPGVERRAAWVVDYAAALAVVEGGLEPVA